MVTWITILITLLASLIPLFLGMFVIKRFPLKIASLLTVLSLWGITLYSFTTLLETNSPHEQEAKLWLCTMATFAMPFWYHLTSLLLPPTISPKRKIMTRFGIPFAYNCLLFTTAGGALIIEGDRYISPLYPILILLVLALGCLSVWNLWDRHRYEDKKQLAVLRIAAISINIKWNRFTLLMIGTASIHLGGIIQGLSELTWWRGDGPMIIGFGLETIGAIFFLRPLAQPTTLNPIPTSNPDTLPPGWVVGLPTTIYALLGLFLLRNDFNSAFGFNSSNSASSSWIFS